VTSAKKKQRLEISLPFLDVNFQMFEKKHTFFTMDDFGMSNNDLQFQDILAEEARL
jgi:hypothetical protein